MTLNVKSERRSSVLSGLRWRDPWLKSSSCPARLQSYTPKWNDDAKKSIDPLFCFQLSIFWIICAYQIRASNIAKNVIYESFYVGLEDTSLHTKSQKKRDQLFKGPIDLKQKCEQLPTPFSDTGTVFNALSLGVIHFVWSVSLRNRFLIGWNSSTTNQKLPFQGY